MLIIINYITPVKVPESIEKEGLDTGLHGERAYDEGAL
jgi:ammonia channel protein AmtB